MSLFKSKKPALKIRGVHLDLKGLPPVPRRLLEILDLMAEVRINCVLVEWEDTYPWGRYPELKCKTAYSMATVKEFLSRAKRLSIQVIPLIQSFGHMENILSRKRFAHLRELQDDVAEICPSKPEGRKVILEMIDDILKTHRGLIEYFHIGGDEAFNIGSCSKCRKITAKEGKTYLYLLHILPLLEKLQAKGLRPILWDDMMRNWQVDSLRKIAQRTDLMCWSYLANPFGWLRKRVLNKYSKAGVNMWGASAFKGGDGLIVDLPNLNNRASNMLAWIKEAKRRNMAGVIATGWGRANTFMPPCESLEASLDLLVIAGVSMWNGSLPRDYAVTANKFLNSGRLRTLFGESFSRCKKASRNLADWRQYFQVSQQQILSLSRMTGEPERRNPRHEQKVLNALEDYLAQGVRFGEAWIKAHSGLVADIWLERYVNSRTMSVRRFIEMVLHNKKVGR